MTQILLKDIEQNIVINLESNTVLPGTYVNAEYQQPEDYRIKQLEKIADMVNRTIANAAANDITVTQQAQAMPLTKRTTKAILTVSDEGATYTFNAAKTPTNNISTFDEVIDHFSEGVGKVFITGVTNSKFDVIDKYFPKINVIKTVENIKPKLKFDPTNYAVTKNNSSRINVTIDRMQNGNQQISLAQVTEQAAKPVKATNLALSATKETKISRFVGDADNNNTAILIQDNLNDNKLIRLNVKFNIPGLDIMVMILKDEPITKISEYVLYLDTPNPIKYVDLGNGTTIFTYLRVDDLPDTTANMILFDGYSEEPKIISEVFIDRGVNSPYERVKKLKNTKTLNELTKNGLGFYKINTKGYNFKNL
jgi:hypothetical protein